EHAHAGVQLDEEVPGKPGGGEAGESAGPAGPGTAAGQVPQAGGDDEGSGGGEYPPVAAPDARDLHQAGEDADPGKEGAGEDDRPRGYGRERGHQAPAAQPRRCRRSGTGRPGARGDGHWVSFVGNGLAGPRPGTGGRGPGGSTAR